MLPMGNQLTITRLEDLHMVMYVCVCVQICVLVLQSKVSTEHNLYNKAAGMRTQTANFYWSHPHTVADVLLNGQM